jgi:tetratricopeptide (TPR) repeat protein
LDTVNNLGNLYTNQGRLKEAEATCMRALHGYEEALSAKQVCTYPPALNTMWNLEDILAQLDQKERAAQMYSDALSGFSLA